MSMLVENESAARTLHQRKATLRSEVLAERDASPPAIRRERSRLIVAGIVALPAFQRAACVLLTASFGSEVETGELVRWTLDAGKTLLLPRVNKAARMLELFEISDPDSQLARGTYGIAEPRPERCRVAAFGDVEWALVPGVVYADDGYRIGYGGGYYDRLLPLLPAATPRVSAAFAFQRRAEVPHGPHDQKIDLLVTESGARRIESSRA